MLAINKQLFTIIMNRNYQIKIMSCLKCFENSSDSSSSQRQHQKIPSIQKLPSRFKWPQTSKHQRPANHLRISLSRKSVLSKKAIEQIKTQESEPPHFLKTEASQQLRYSMSQPIFLNTTQPIYNFRADPPIIENQRTRPIIMKPPSFIKRITFETPMQASIKSPKQSVPQIKMTYIQSSFTQSKQTLNDKLMRSTMPSFNINNIDVPKADSHVDVENQENSLVSSTSIKVQQGEFSIDEDKEMCKSQGLLKVEAKDFLSPPSRINHPLSKSMAIRNLDQIAFTETISDGSSKHESEFSEVIGGSADLMRGYQISMQDIHILQSQPLIYHRRRSKPQHHRKDSLSQQ